LGRRSPACSRHEAVIDKYAVNTATSMTTTPK